MNSADNKIRKAPGGGLKTLDDLEEMDVPAYSTSFNTCTRSGSDRRQLPDRRRRPRIDCEERRSGRDRRIMTYF